MIELNADAMVAWPDDDECLASVYFRDADADYAFALSRFNDPVQDNGKIEVLVRDQINEETDDLLVTLENGKMITRICDEAVANRLGVTHIVVNF
ncbi:MAG TPA: hypothetical protein VGZ25_13670, partial [Gemmataceae bacterium]|nr:hypothetical protein [Gemmataceae bacterium]